MVNLGVKSLYSLILLGFILYLPLFTAIGEVAGGVWVFLPLVVMYFFAPLADLVLIKFFPDWQKVNIFKYSQYQLVDLGLKFYPLIQWSLFIYFMFKYQNSTEGLSISGIMMGLTSGGAGLLVAHELMHRKDKISQFGASALCMMVGYAHWPMEHVHGHHKNVATPLDPCTAKKGDILYGFYFRSVIGQIFSAYRINRSHFLKVKLIELILLGSLFYYFGLNGVIFWGVQALVGTFLLENLNYVEHYGLLRKKNPSGRYSKVLPEHSWETRSILSNMSVINLGLHSDHHALVDKKFWELESVPNTSSLNIGIPGQMLLSLVPPLWFQYMQRRMS